MKTVVFWFKYFKEKMIEVPDEKYDSESGAYIKTTKLVPEFTWGLGKYGYVDLDARRATDDFISELYHKLRHKLKYIQVPRLLIEDISFKRVSVSGILYTPYCIEDMEDGDIRHTSSKRVEYCDVAHVAVFEDKSYIDVTEDFRYRDIWQYYDQYLSSSKLATYKKIRRCFFKDIDVHGPSQLEDVWYIEDKDDTIEVSSYCPIKSTHHKKFKHVLGSHGNTGRHRSWKFKTTNRHQWEHNLTGEYTWKCRDLQYGDGIIQNKN